MVIRIPTRIMVTPTTRILMPTAIRTMALVLESDTDTEVDTTAAIVADITDTAAATAIAVVTEGQWSAAVVADTVVARFVVAADAANYHARVY